MSGRPPSGTLHIPTRTGEFSPGWAKPEPSLWNEPKHDFRTAYFSYALARERLDEADDFASPAQAERRNLICVNPKEGSFYATAANLVAAYQMVKPGEQARSHRHSPSALRLILDAPEDTYTVVDGNRIDMSPGDVVLTPSWCWHGHANDGDAAAYWIDFLDVPYVQHVGAMFFEPHPLTYEPVARSELSSPMRISTTKPTGPQPQSSSVRSIAVGLLPTIGLDLVALVRGHPLRYPKTTANAIYAVVDGECVVTVESAGEDEGVSGRYPLHRGDVLALPTWTDHTLASQGQTTLLRVSDTPIMAAADLLRVGASTITALSVRPLSE